MRLAATIERDGRWWLVEVPLLNAMTQGRTKKEAYAMAADLVESMVFKEGFAATVTPAGKNTLEIDSNNPGALIAVVLKRQREKAGLTLAEVSERLGASSRNTYARYEQGKSVPTIAKLSELMSAIGNGRSFVIAEAKAGVKAAS